MLNHGLVETLQEPEGLQSLWDAGRIRDATTWCT